MNVPMSELFILLPEIFVLSMACIILIVAVYIPEQLKELNYHLAQVTVVGAAIFAAALAQSTICSRGTVCSFFAVAEPAAGKTG